MSNYTDIVVADSVDYLFILDDYIGPTGTESYTDVSLGTTTGDATYIVDTNSGGGNNSTDQLIPGDDCFTLGAETGGTDNCTVNCATSAYAYSQNDRAIEFWFRVNSLDYDSVWEYLAYLYEQGYEISANHISVHLDDAGTSNAPRVRGVFKHSTSTVATDWIEIEEGVTYHCYVDFIKGTDLVGRIRLNDDSALEKTVTVTGGSFYQVHDTNFSMKVMSKAASTKDADIDIGMLALYDNTTLTAQQITDHFEAGSAITWNMTGSGDLALSTWLMADIVDGAPPKSLQVEADISQLLTNSPTNAGVFARYQSSDTFYAAMYEKSGGTDQWVLLKMDGGTRTDLDTATIVTLTDAAYHISLTIIDDDLELVVNNTAVCTATDTGITAAGKYGILYRA